MPEVGQQFRHYQMPLPGMEAPAFPAEGHVQVPVDQIFRHPRIEPSTREYDLVNHYTPRRVRVKASALRPTQAVVDEGTIHRPRESGSIGAIQDTRGRYRLVDGHHKVAHALLTGQRHVEALVWHERMT